MVCDTDIYPIIKESNMFSFVLTYLSGPGGAVENRGLRFQQTPRDLANVNALKNHV